MTCVEDSRELEPQAHDTALERASLDGELAARLASVVFEWRVARPAGVVPHVEHWMSQRASLIHAS